MTVSTQLAIYIHSILHFCML